MPTLPDNALKRGWNYVIEAPSGAHVPPDVWRTTSGDGALLTKRPHGYPGRFEVIDGSSAALPRAALLRAAAAAGHAWEALGHDPRRPLRVRLARAGTATTLGCDEGGVLTLAVDGPWLAQVGSHHPVNSAFVAALTTLPPVVVAGASPSAADARPARRVLFFESLMNTDIDHNDQELSQGVLHMVSALSDHPSRPVLVRVKMTLYEQFRHERDEAQAIIGLDRLDAALADGDIDLVCITLLEAYFDGVIELIAALRARGCRAPIAVGGVMPTLTPEHVAAHLEDVSFVCRGAGEHFLPALCDVLGGASIDTPFTAAQRAAFLNVPGLIAIDRAGRALIAADTSISAQVADLDRVPLDLSYLRRDHLVHGVEIATSRGCIHKCSFCTIIGQMTYQARSAEGLFALLQRYAERFAELFGPDGIPERVWRVHFSDDDFACDRARATAFFRQLSSTRFRLASCQVSIADLCQTQGKQAVPVVDEGLLDAMDPAHFFDTQRRISAREYIEDYGERRWSANLQMGVESFCDAELVRHAKGYKRAHIRVVMAAMAARGLHLDAYFILSNVDTTADDLIDALEEACRLKLAHPVHFHVKYPVTPRIVSIYPSASYRRHLRNGKRAQLTLRRDGRVPGFAEFDYPFVEHDRPLDDWVEDAVVAPFFSGEARYIASLEALRARWQARAATLADGPERRRGRRLVRRLDDVRRRLVFGHLRAVGLQPAAETAGDDQARRVARETAVELLGPAQTWFDAYRRDAATGAAVLRLSAGASWDAACDLLASSVREGVLLADPSDVPLGSGALPTGVAVYAELRLQHIEALREIPAGVGIALTLAPDDAVDSKLVPFAQAAAARGMVRLAISAEPWTQAQQRALASALQRVGAALGSRLAVSSRTTPVITLDASGTLSAAGSARARLDDLTGLDRVLRDTAPVPATPAQRILDSYLRYHGEHANDPAPPRRAGGGLDALG